MNLFSVPSNSMKQPPRFHYSALLVRCLFTVEQGPPHLHAGWPDSLMGPLMVIYWPGPNG